LDIAKVKDIVEQVRGALSLLPKDTRKELLPVLDEIQAETVSRKPDHSKLCELLTSVRTICEGVVGNVVAQGIVSAIEKLF
jgi:hypothetical protein